MGVVACVCMCVGVGLVFEYVGVSVCGWMYEWVGVCVCGWRGVYGCVWVCVYVCVINHWCRMYVRVCDEFYNHQGICLVDIFSCF